VIGWIDWLVEFFRDDPASVEALLGRDAVVITAVTRGRKTGGPTTAAEFEIFKAGLRAWVCGQPFDQIETALGVPAGAVGICGRARDLVHKLANRRLYIIFVAVAELAKLRSAAAEIPIANRALIEILPIAIRKGYDSAEKAAFAHINPILRTRVGVHRAFQRRLGAMELVGGQTFQEVMRHVEVVLAFAALDDD
jgi:hypothetical protein